jgi:hypothetical protein
MMRAVANTYEAGRVVALHTAVACVLDTVGLAKIRPPVIGSVAVNVVDFLSRPFSGHDQPRNAVG